MKKVIGLVLLVAVGAIFAYTLMGGESAEDYRERIAEERLRTERFMKGSPESPFAPDSLEFTALSYYPADPAYRVRARVEPVKDKKLMVLPTSTGEEEKYIRYGYAVFELKGQQHRLLVLEPFEQPAQLFIAFADDTSGDTTYGGGRYLNVDKPTRTGQKTLELDFNQAYNPYCAYNGSFSCPLPPKENLLVTAIEAGEKTYP